LVFHAICIARFESSEVNDTIVAIATPAGSGGVGIVRLSGARARAIAQTLCRRKLAPRRAQYVRFYGGGVVDHSTDYSTDHSNADERMLESRADPGTDNGHSGHDSIDDGIALYFAAPASYTGEDVAELQAHGSPAVLRQLLRCCCELGARLARPGEFSERAYLNGRLDLVQAEAVADLIAAGDARAARAARRALDGEFSRRIAALTEALTALRVHVEAAIDFADEPLDTLGGTALRANLDRLRVDVSTLLSDAERGRKLREGMHVVIVGPPNAGKSTLFNALSQSDRAIVTPVAGTTRDLLQEHVQVDGVELTLLDTAGLHEGGDAIEREGMRRARAELARADLALVVIDASAPGPQWDQNEAALVDVPARIVLYNKSDLLADADTVPKGALAISAATGAGLDALHTQLRQMVTGNAAIGDGTFTARARHVEALRRSVDTLAQAETALHAEQLDLAAEALRLTQDILGEITGRTLPDALLGRIFANFCIGK